MNTQHSVALEEDSNPENRNASESGTDAETRQKVTENIEFYYANVRKLRARNRATVDSAHILMKQTEIVLRKRLARFPGAAAQLIDLLDDNGPGTRLHDHGATMDNHAPTQAPDVTTSKLSGQTSNAAEEGRCPPAVTSESFEILRRNLTNLEQALSDGSASSRKSRSCRKSISRSFCEIALSPAQIRHLVNHVDSVLNSLADRQSETFIHELCLLSGLRVADIETLGRQIISSYRNWLYIRNRLAGYHLGLVAHIARQYSADRQDLIDIVQEGNIGLITAVERYNHELGYKFSTYAAYWIKLAISRYLSRNRRCVSIPYRHSIQLGTVARLKNGLAAKLGRAPTADELSGESGISTENLRNLEFISQSVASLNQPVAADSELEASSMLEQRTFDSPMDVLAKEKIGKILNDSILTLNQREAYVIRQRFGIGVYSDKTLQEIGSMLGVTRERVRQIEVQAIRKIRLHLQPVMT